MVYFCCMEDGGLLLEEEKETERQYRFSLWWVSHRAQLKRLAIGLFIAVDAGLLLFGGWHLLDAFAISYGDEQLAVAKMVAYGQADLHAYTVANAAEDLDVDREKVFSTGNGTYDLYASLINPNDDWWAEFTYSFDTDLDNGEVHEGFILPGETKPIVDLAVESEVPITEAVLSIKDVQWRRVDHHLVNDYSQWSSDRLNIIVSDLVYSKETRFDDTIFGRTSFTLENATAFSYYDPVLYVLLKKGDSVVGVNRTTLTDLDSGVSKDVVLNWFGALPSVGDVEVVVELDLFDLDTYKALEGESTRDTRTRVFR